MKINQVFVTVKINNMEEALPFYERLTGQSQENRWKSAELQLEFCTVGSFVLVAGTDEALAIVSDIHHILSVDALQDFQDFFAGNGVEVIRGPITNPAGTIIIVKNPNGQVLEYLQPHS